MKLPRQSGRRHHCRFLASLLLAPALSPAGILDFFYPDRDLQTITVTDFAPAAGLRRAPTPEDPVYYVAVSGGYRDLGGIKAGEKPIARDVVNKTMLKALAKQNYLPATEEHGADIVLVWTWGTFNRVLSPLLDVPAQLNRRQMLRFLGGDKLGLTSRFNDQLSHEMLLPGLLMNGVDAHNLSDAATDDLFFAVITAFDALPGKDNRPVVLWNTRISCPARGFWLPEAMPAMLAIAHPYIGRETSKPVWVSATEKFKPDIILGDTKLVEFIESGKPTVIELGPSS